MNILYEMFLVLVISERIHHQKCLFIVNSTILLVFLPLDKRSLTQMKTCKRCFTSFLCNQDKIENCFCSSVKLAPETLDFLKKTKYDCLCEKCLVEVNDLVIKSKDFSFPEKGEPLVENLHYYIENGYWVFTEFYHLLRGTCCGNNCRHCA